MIWILAQNTKGFQNTLPHSAIFGLCCDFTSPTLPYDKWKFLPPGKITSF